MRARWSLALAAVCALVLLGAAPASAADPVSLGSGYVQDDAAVLGSAEVEAAEARLEQLADETGLDLWVVFVDRFSNPADAETWANTTAEQNGLGTNQYLLAIAVDAGQFYLSGDLAGPLDETQLQNIEQQSVLPALRDDDFAGAIEGAADGITDAAGGGSGSTDGSGGIDAGVIIAVVAGAAIVAVVIFFIVRSRRRRGAGGVTARPVESTADLARRASAALVATDDALRTGEQELGFATAEFPETATADFTAALAASRAELDRAFALRQQLDDEVADTDEQVRAWHTEVLALCAQATGQLEEQSERFADLRRLGQDAPAAIDRLTAARATAEAAVAPAAERLARLQTAYAAPALVTVTDNLEQAQLRLRFADEQLAAARAAVAAGESGDAAVAVRAAEDAVAQAQGLAQAVLTLDEQLSAAAAQVPALTAELQRDIAASATLPDAGGHLGSAVAAARAELDAVAAGATATDPIAALQRLQAADTALDAHLESARDAAARLARAQQLLGPALAQAQAQISAAEDFIAARRGAVGATARTRLSEASAAFGQALQEQSVDAERALQYAQRAAQLAAAATDSARGDVDAFAPRGGGGGSDMGAMLGGLLVGSLLGGGRGNSGFGGGFGGGRPRSGGFGGGFGGSGRSRSGGGSFGGGGRSRRGGGRF